MTKRCKLVGLDFDIGDGSNVRYMKCDIPGAVVDVKASQSLEEGIYERLCSDISGV